MQPCGNVSLSDSEDNSNDRSQDKVQTNEEIRLNKQQLDNEKRRKFLTGSLDLKQDDRVSQHSKLKEISYNSKDNVKASEIESLLIEESKGDFNFTDENCAISSKSKTTLTTIDSISALKKEEAERRMRLVRYEQRKNPDFFLK